MDGILASQIEALLIRRRDWVTGEEICETLGLADDRPLRAAHGEPGLCSGFAISGNKGFKHVTMANTTEWLRFKHRLKHHGISELVRVRNLDKIRSTATRTIKRPAITLERDSNQTLLFKEGQTA